MNQDGLKKTEKILRRIFLLLGVVTVVGVILLIRFGGDKPPAIESMEEPVEEQDYNWEAGLSDATYWLPEFGNLYEEIPEISFTDKDGKEHSISEWRGQVTVLMFWAGWCGDCQLQLEQMSEYMELAKSYGDISFILINKTDEVKETRQTAEEYFDRLDLGVEMYYDYEEKAFRTLGIRNIPTTIFLNQEGQIISWYPKQITEKGVFEALLKNASEGSSRTSIEFITGKMMNEDGGIQTVYDAAESLNADHSVLSESQGLLMLYAVEAGDQKLFDRALAYVRDKMWEKDSLAAWRVENNQRSSVNALIDDFRIYRGLLLAKETWGGYEEAILHCENTLRSYGMSENRYVDFYDYENKQYASRFTLCYADLAAMETLAGKYEDTVEAYREAANILEQGQISNEFPLYYSWYNYDRKRYEKDDLNTAEAMVTLLNLARQGKLKNNTVKWLKAQLSGGGLKARYTVDGREVRDYQYESTAVYAIVVMIADEIGDETLRGQALKKMEKMHITDTSLSYNGAFCMEDGTGISSFDQLMPLLAYIRMENQ